MTAFTRTEYTALRVPTLVKSDPATARVYNIYSLFGCRQRRALLALKTYHRLHAAMETYKQDNQVIYAELARLLPQNDATPGYDDKIGGALKVPHQISSWQIYSTAR